MKDFLKFIFRIFTHFLAFVCFFAAALYQTMEMIAEKLFPDIDESQKENLAGILYIAFDILMIIVLIYIVNYLDTLLSNMIGYGTFHKIPDHINNGSLI